MDVESELVGLLEQGDFTRVASMALETYGSEIYGFLVNEARDDAPDVFSAVCERMWRGLPEFEGRCSMRTWLYVLAGMLPEWRKSPRNRRDLHTGISELDAIVERSGRKRSRGVGPRSRIASVRCAIRCRSMIERCSCCESTALSNGTISRESCSGLRRPPRHRARVSTVEEALPVDQGRAARPSSRGRDRGCRLTTSCEPSRPYPRIAPPARYATAIVAVDVHEVDATVVVGANRVGSAATRALAIRREMPSVRIALATEQVTADASIARDCLNAPGARSPAGDGEIALDAATRRLLDTGFVIREDVLVREVAFAPGDRLGSRYSIAELVGEGGMGAVYRALDEKLGLEVALKLVRGRGPDDALRDEVRLAQRVTHRNVCRTISRRSTVTTSSRWSSSRETLAARLRRGPVSIADGVRIVLAVADALAAAHEQGVVHRDVKPENIMLADDRVVLMDFGVARAAGVTGALGGTLGYMPPEVIAGGEVDERADLFALGCVLAELIASAPRRTPRWLQRAADLLRHRRPERRLVGLRQLRRGARRWPLLAAGLALVVLALLGWRLTADRAWAPHVVDLPVYEENSDTAVLSPDGRWLAISSDRGTPNNLQLYIVDRITGAASVFTTRPDWIALHPTWTHDGRALLYSAVQVRCDGRPCINPVADGHVMRQRVTGSPPRPDGPPEDLGTGDRYDDCGDALVVVEMHLDGWRLVLRAPDGSRRELVSVTPDEFILSPACSPDGSQIAFVRGRAFEISGNDVFVIDRRGNTRQLTSDHATRAVAWNPDGRSLILVHADKLDELPITGGARSPILSDVEMRARHRSPPTASSSGTSGTISSFLPIVYGETGDPHFVTRQRGMFWFVRQANDEFAVAQNGHGSDWDIVALRLRDGAITNLGPGTLPFPARDGKRVYFGSRDAPGTLFVVPIAGGARTTVARLPAKLDSATTHPTASTCS